MKHYQVSKENQIWRKPYHKDNHYIIYSNGRVWSKKKKRFLTTKTYKGHESIGDTCCCTSVGKLYWSDLGYDFYLNDKLCRQMFDGNTAKEYREFITEHYARMKAFRESES